MLIAEELDVAWSQVEVEQLPYGIVASPEPPGLASKYGPQGAGGSTSIPDGFESLRQAGAKARWLLVAAAAEEWNVEANRLTTREGRVFHFDGRSLGYAELAAAASQLEAPDYPLPLKPPADFRIIGQPVRVADARDIVTGKAAYGIDARVPDALTAMIERCPYFDGRIARFDATAARRVPGVREIVVIPGPQPDQPLNRALAAGIAVVAEDTWSARKGREALKIEWRPGPHAQDSTGALAQRALEAARRPGTVARTDGNFDSARAAAARVVEAEYTQPFLAHATLEPMNALLDLKSDRALLVAPIQSPGSASRLINAMTGIPRLNIEIRLVRSGGGFGRRLENDYVAEAVYIARVVKAPVKLLWSREDDLRNDFYRPFGVHAFAAALDSQGNVTGWRHRVAATSRKWRVEDMGDAEDWIGCADPDGFPAGSVPNYSCEFSAVEFGLARGWWRAPLPMFVAFPTQSFVDEVAIASGQDPLALRLKLLGESRELDYRDHGGPKFHTGRMAAVLRRAAERIGWGGALPKGTGRGIAGHFVFGGYTAHAMEVTVAAGELRIGRCVCVGDVGTVVNPLGVEAQLSGGTIDGLSTALNLGITVEAGRIVQSNFSDYPLLRLAQAPDVEVEILRTDFAPSGAGEMGIPSAVPALTNAIYAASGMRIRNLPVAGQLRGTAS
ncbi:MAG TPA: molybdopterin cofactor-binding domain-containing protein, partial [Steroidobacteraceae bacterium]|nr:molybdopterin cofactor-binding domain-containing protein [Steroidobacteraceae bacterium]